MLGWISCARGPSNRVKERVGRAVGKGNRAGLDVEVAWQHPNRDLPVDDRKVLMAPGLQTCCTTSEAGKRTFFWEAYLSSSARYPAAHATTVL